MNTNLIIILIILIIVSSYYIFIHDENAKDAKKDIISEIKNISFDKYKTLYGKDFDDYDVGISFINAKTYAIKGDENELKDHLNGKTN